MKCCLLIVEKRGSTRDGRTQCCDGKTCCMKRRRRMKKRESMRTRSCADGRTGLLHKITKPTAWRGGVQILEEEEKDVRQVKKRGREWAKHQQCNTEMQDLRDKPWRHEEVNKIEGRAAEVEGRRFREGKEKLTCSDGSGM